MDPVAVLDLSGGTSSQWRIERRAVIGRSADVDVAIDVPSLSRRHAEVIAADGGWLVRDLGSRNGTFVGGEPVGEDGVRLRDGDELVLGSAVTIVFRDPDATPMLPRIGRLRGVWMDPLDPVVYVDARPLDPPLSGRQLRLLEVLYEADGAVVSRRDLVDRVWADEAAEGVTDDALSALLKRLRQRLAEAGLGDEFIDIVRGHGVRLRVE